MHHLRGNKLEDKRILFSQGVSKSYPLLSSCVSHVLNEKHRLNVKIFYKMRYV